MILVTASTGKLGHHVIKHLLHRVPASEIVAGVRDRQKAKEFSDKGIELRELDYSKPAVIASAMLGVDKVLLISGNEGERVAGHKAVIDAAKKAGVKLLVYTSALNADTGKTLIHADHKATEALIRESGIPYVFLRNGWYTENYTENVGPALQHGAMFGATKDAKFSLAPREEYAEAAAIVLTTEGHLNKTYELAGDTPVSMSEIAAEVARASGKPVAYKDLPHAEYHAMLEKVGVPSGLATLLSDSDVGIARGELASKSKDLSKLLGRPTTTLAKTIEGALR
jgi:NAD(P)H dehydrogenase (quinone)